MSPSKLTPATNYLLPDEKALALVEMNLVTPDGKARHRYQIVYVARKDRLAEFRTDLGPASDFIGAELRLVGGIIHGNGRAELIETVARLQELAEDFRNTKPLIPEGHVIGHRREQGRPYISAAR